MEKYLHDKQSHRATSSLGKNVMEIQQLANNSVKQILKLTIASFFFVPWIATTNIKQAYACSCLPPEGPKAELEKAKAVFAGTVLEKIERTDPQANFRFDSVKVRFKVSEVWKGIVGKREVVITTGPNSAACGFFFEQGKKYLVYASSPNNSSLSTSLCSRTKLFSNAQEDLSELGDPKNPRKRRQEPRKREDSE